MPYILFKTDGTRLARVDDASLDVSTSLSFVGRNYSGYGQVVNENFLKLLENFSNDTQPEKPIRGQLWFDKLNGRLNVSYDGRSFKGIASIFVQENTPPSSALVTGDLWWDKNAFQLKAFDGSQFQSVGPFDPASGRATWIPSEESTGVDVAVTTPITQATIDNEVVVIISKQSFNPTSILSPTFPVIKRGITLSNVDTNGKSTNENTILWGTASHAKNADLATTATYAVQLLSGGAPSLRSSTSTNLISYYSTASTSTIAYSIVQRNSHGDIYTNVFRGIATSAQYADLAERYHADDRYDIGTVLVIGGTNEVTTTDVRANVSVIGVVSSNPAFAMNENAGNQETHPYIALKGRVPCKVIGPISKGDLLVTSSVKGYAEQAKDQDRDSSVFAKALEDFYKPEGTIEVLVI